MDIEKILKLVEVGFTKEEILQLAGSTPGGNVTADEQQAGAENSKKNESTNENTNTNTSTNTGAGNDTAEKLLASMQQLTKVIQASNLKNDTVTTVQQSTEDIINSMFGKKEK